MRIKAISIDPTARPITAIEISPEARLLRDFFGEKPKLAARLPKGDSLLTTAVAPLAPASDDQAGTDERARSTDGEGLSIP